MGRFVLAGLLLLLARPAFAKGELTWKWKKEDTFYVKTVSRIKQKLVIDHAGSRDQGREVSQEFELTTLFHYTVRKVNDNGSAELVQKVEEMIVQTKMPLEDKKISRTDSSLKDVELVLHVTPGGEVTRVEGAEGLLKKLAGSGSVKRQRALLAEAVSAEALKAQATQALGFLPDQPLKKGLRWQRPAGLALGALGHLDAERSYAYDGSPSAKGPVKITFTTVVKSFKPGKGDPAKLLVTHGKFKTAKGEGSLEFDAAAGRLLKANSSLELQGDITFKDPDAESEYRGQLKQEHATETTVTDKKPK